MSAIVVDLRRLRGRGRGTWSARRATLPARSPLRGVGIMGSAAHDSGGDSADDCAEEGDPQPEVDRDLLDRFCRALDPYR